MTPAVATGPAPPPPLPPARLSPHAAPLYRQISEHLLESILSGRLQAGDALPTEHALCAHYGVSRITVRKALDELASRRVVIRRRGRGNFVDDPVRAVKSVTLTGHIDEVLPRNHIVVLSEGWMPPPPSVARFVPGLDANEPLKVFEAVNHVGEGEPLDSVSFYFPVSVGRRLGAADIAGPLPPIKFLQLRLGCRVHHADQLVEPVTASRRVAERLGIRRGTAVLRALRAYYDTSGQLLEIVDAIYHPQRYRYTATLYPRAGAEA